MKHNFICTIAICTVLSLALSSCTGASSSDTSTESSSLAIASGEQTIATENIIDDNMNPINGSDIKDGIYHINVDSSSAMFSIDECILTVSNGKMTALMTMGGKGYLYVYMGTAEEAAQADEFISYDETTDGKHTFTVPVNALDQGLSCAAFSKNKEIWYDRTLVFRADSLPSEAFKDGVISTIESLGLTDGEYTIEATVEGGSGRASISNPLKLYINDGKATAEIIWSSSNYDYMVVDGVRFELTNTEGNSTFEIPVTGFDYKMPVSANTIAMSTPHEIEYTIYFDSSSIVESIS